MANYLMAIHFLAQKPASFSLLLQKGNKPLHELTSGILHVDFYLQTGILSWLREIKQTH